MKATLAFVFRLLGLGCLGWLVVLVLVVVFGIGCYLAGVTNLGARWVYELTEQGTSRQKSIELDKGQAMPQEDLLSMVREGRLRGDIQLYSRPTGWKVLTAGVGLELTKEEDRALVRSVLGGGAGFQDALARQLFGPDADRTMNQLLATKSAPELTAMFGPNYQQTLNGLFAGRTNQTLGQVFAQDREAVFRALTPQALDGMAGKLFGAVADQTMPMLLQWMPPQQLREMLGENYGDALNRLYGGSSAKTLRQVFVENPGRMIDVYLSTMLGKLGFGQW